MKLNLLDLEHYCYYNCCSIDKNGFGCNNCLEIDPRYRAYWVGLNGHKLLSYYNGICRGTSFELEPYGQKEVEYFHFYRRGVEDRSKLIHICCTTGFQKWVYYYPGKNKNSENVHIHNIEYGDDNQALLDMLRIGRDIMQKMYNQLICAAYADINIKRVPYGEPTVKSDPADA